MASKPQLFALLVGIDNYHPDSQVSPLDGAARDARSVGDFLKSTWEPGTQEISLLLNDQATRKSIIDQFGYMAREARPGDSVLFHYSGHGSRETAPAEFLPFFPEGLNETLVAYDSRLSDGFDIADKELAILLAAFAEGVHLTVVADSCHSGSITRSAQVTQLGKVRMIPGPNGERPLDTYLDGYYRNQLHTTGRIVIPAQVHAAISACKRTEEAHETNDGRGYFTTAMLDVLSSSGPTVNYADLFSRTRSLLGTRFAGQTPQFEYTAGFNPWEAWLGQKGGGRPRYSQVTFDKQNWSINLGAVHGFQADQQALVPLLETQTGKVVLGNARLVHVGVQTSQLDVSGLNLDPQKVYYGAAAASPATVYFPASFLKGAVRTLWEDNYAAVFQPTRAVEADYRIKKTTEGWGIYDRQNKFLHGFKTLSPYPAAAYLFPKLEKLATYQNMLELSNTKSLIKPQDLEFTFHEVQSDGSLKALAGDKVMVDFLKAEDGWKPIDYAISARNKSARSLYFTLIYLSGELGIQVHYQDKVLHPGGGAEVMLNNDRALGIANPNLQVSLDRFRLIASTEPLDAYLFEQEEVEDWGSWVSPESTKSVSTRSLFRREPAADWQTRLIEVEVVRQESKIGKTASRAASGQIEFGAHEVLEATISTISVDSLDAEVTHWLRSIPSVTDIGISSATRSVGASSLAGIELAGFTTGVSLEKNPLDIRVQASLKSNEYLLPLAYDGVHFLPVGHVESQEGSSLLVRMNSLPSSATRTRSLGGAIKTYFLKVSGKESGMKLSRIEWTKDGIHQFTDGLPEAVKKANRILVIVHGIIGASKDIASGLRFALAPDRYDLILTFDYENLGTPISETARALKELLTECGATQGKYVDFLVHSMGGLVSRWLIEKEGGDAFIKQLFMFGTPNSGSAFSNLAPVINGLVALAANLAHPGLGSLVATTQVFGKYHLTTTLSDMDKDSDILNLLNRPDKFSTRYSIVAGDIFGKKEDDGGFFDNFMTKLINFTGNLIYKEPNDVAVAVKSILSPKEAIGVKNYQTKCNHLIYFSDPESLKLAKQIVYPLK